MIPPVIDAYIRQIADHDCILFLTVKTSIKFIFGCRFIAFRLARTESGNGIG